LSSLTKVAASLLGDTAGRTEADIQSDVRALLLSDALNLAADQVVHLEEQTKDGTRRRIDIAVAHAIIEVKKSLSSPVVVVEAVTQLEGYMRTRAQQFDRRYVGLLTDGREWILYDLIDDVATEAARFGLTADNVEGLASWLEAVLATETSVPPTPDEIRARLGAESPAYLLDKAELNALYEAAADHPEIVLKRQLWAKLLRTAFGAAFSDDADTFVDHTLLVVTAEIIAHTVLGLDVSATGDITPNDLVAGTKFDEAGLYGVVESDFFDWVVHVDGGSSFIRTLADRIARFDWSNVQHDVLKHLYESVISADDRRALGEYYTPDWLADRVVAATVSDPLSQRVLDPSCGSGTFLFHAIRAYLTAAASAGVSDADALASLTVHVFGVDIHPVSVTLARVTYLLAIGEDRLAGDRPPSMSIPVFLGDSLQWEQRVDLFHTDDLVTISTSGSEFMEDGASLTGADLVFPRSVLADAARFDRLVSTMADRALDVTGTKNRTIAQEIAKTFKLTDDEAAVVGPTFATMRSLHQAGRNHIWGFYVRNLIRPIWLADPSNKVDVLVGNPPWLRYSKMTKAMQDRYQSLAGPRNLLSGPLGASSRDLSTLFVTRAVEMYLKPGGHFAFVMPHGTMTRKPHTGFRDGNWSPDDTSSGRLVVAFDKSWDLRDAPTGFPNLSCVIRGRHVADPKGNSKSMGRDVALWSAQFGNPNQSWVDVEPSFTVTDGSVMIINSDDDTPTSPYVRQFRQGAVLVPRVLFMVDRVAAGPLGVGAGRVRVRTRRSSQEKRPWKDLSVPDKVIEKSFVRDTHFGETTVPYGFLDARGSLIPATEHLLNRSEIKSHADLEKWWVSAESVWEANRSTSDQSSLLERLDYMSQLSSQFPLATHRVVYTKAGNSLNAARLSNSDAIIDQKLYWAPVDSVDEARYLVGILNSTVLLDRVRPLQAIGLFGARDFDKAVFAVPFARYDPLNTDHAKIATLTGEAEQAVSALALPAEFTPARRLVRETLVSSGLQAQIEDAVEAVLPVVG
jgi:SAM-dependent methyltransferase